MSKTLKKFKKQYDPDDNHHNARRRKVVVKNKQLRTIDNFLKKKDVVNLKNYDDQLIGG
jgi:hypothetical protein